MCVCVCVCVRERKRERRKEENKGNERAERWKYIEERDFYYDYETFVPGKIAKTNEEIIEIIKNKDFNMNKNKEFRKDFLGMADGESAKRISLFIESKLK